jgi:hypothetical protein
MDGAGLNRLTCACWGSVTIRAIRGQVPNAVLFGLSSATPSEPRVSPPPVERGEVAVVRPDIEVPSVLVFRHELVDSLLRTC